MRVAVLVLVCTVAFIPSAFAQNALSTDPDSAGREATASLNEGRTDRVLRFSFEAAAAATEAALPSLRASILARSALRDTTPQLPTVASNPDKTTHLVIGLAGVGLAVASIPIISNADCRLGEYCTKLQVGTYMLATGGVLAAFYLWKAFK